MLRRTGGGGATPHERWCCAIAETPRRCMQFADRPIELPEQPKRREPKPRQKANPVMYRMKNPPRRQIIAMGALALLIPGGCSKPSASAPTAASPIPVNTCLVVSKDVPVELRAIGNVEAIAAVGIKAQVAGELLSVNFEEGKEVKKGETLFTIEPKIYATQLAQVESVLARDRVQGANAQRESARGTELSAKGAISREQLDQAHAQAAALEATIKGDEAALELARVQLGYTTVRAPMDGRTGAR